MNKEQILEEINKAEEHIANMKKILKECEYKRWKPKNGEKFFFIDAWSRACCKNYKETDRCCYEYHSTYNCFKTEKEAEEEAEKISVRRMLEDIASRLNKGKKFDWSNNSQNKYYLYLWLGKELEQHIASVRLVQGVVYCLDENFLDIVIQEIGEDRLKKYLRGE